MVLHVDCGRVLLIQRCLLAVEISIYQDLLSLKSKSKDQLYDLEKDLGESLL